MNFVRRPDRVSGSVRRWSADRSINDGRPFEVAADALSPQGEFTTPCVCGRELAVSTQATGGERDAGLRVTF